MQSTLARRKRFGSSGSLGGTKEVTRADLFKPRVQLLQVVLIFFQRGESQIACFGLLRNLREEVTTLHTKLNVFLVTVCTETFDNLGRSVSIERRRNHQYS